MRCHLCGAEMHPLVTDLPFKVTEVTTVVLKDLPVLQCENCREYLIEDAVMERVEAMLGQVGEETELEVLRFAA